MSLARNSQSGSALLMTLLVVTMLFGIAAAYLTASYGSFEGSNRELATVEARLSAEDGIQLAVAELKSGVDATGGGLGNLTSTAADGRTITVTSTNLGGGLYKIHSVAVLNRARTGADALCELIPQGGLNANVHAAITSKGSVQTLGTIVVDGRDWNTVGTSIVGSGVYGVTSASTITSSGNSKIGGNGIAPAKPPPAGTYSPNSTFTDGVDNDGDGVQNEEAFDGVDNDGDGQVDEDTQGFPASPDIALHVAPGTLKAAAIASSTYFTSSAQVTACIAANGGALPGGKIIYCDFSSWSPVQLGAFYNATPSILVHHNSTSTATMGNVTGMFKGLLMVDSVQHFTGTCKILGAVMSFSSSAIGNAFGLGNADIYYSSGVLANLPSAGGSTKARIRSWNRSAAY